ncbi:unnamed protein product [Oppiella nova]|uniref:Peptidase C1A papain C-terminal domain-containing protein n=1 Tax=Oppiella nova TaxID=334625 RepID=A0A7R9M8G0_9ACAR|nr:unnamed protein product [Oppiella nova]CAG2172158.1 unnamed protein product [Oppiella nova]
MYEIYSKDSFERFGDDLCEVLLSYLSFEDRFRYECLSKQFRRLIYTTLSELTIDRKIMKNIVKADNFGDNYFEFNILSQIAKKCPNLQRIDCSQLRPNERPVFAAIHALRDNCPHLRHYYCTFHGSDDRLIGPLFTRFGQICRSILVNVESGDELALKGAVATVGPISVAMDASDNKLRLYKSGVYRNAVCFTHMEGLNHAVTAVGYGSDGGDDYWIIKNSWGAQWGDRGYLKIARNAGNVCGIATTPSYPIGVQ